MKYANVYYPNGTTGRNKKRGKINIGDAFQWLAIQHIYELMGIDTAKLVQIPKDELGIYDGEEVVCPINFLHANYINEGHMFPFSPKIIPIFLGLSLGDIYLHSEEIKYLKKYEPIGCRDEDTCKRLRDYGVNAYTNGCLTATFPVRNAETRNKIYFIDVPETVLQYIPDSIRSAAIKRSAIIENNNIEDINRYVSDLYNEYKREAELIVTSRLHTAIPCWAAGIPVIMIAENFSYTYSWVEKVIPFYLCSEAMKIDWQVKNYINPDIKKQMLEIAMQRIAGKKVTTAQIEAVNNYWNTRKKRTCTHLTEILYDKLKSNFSDKDGIQYCLWGYTPMAEAVYIHISELYPQAELVAFFDRDKKGYFHGIPLSGFENMKNYSSAYMIVCGFSACLTADRKLQEIGWNMNRIFMIYPYK